MASRRRTPLPLDPVASARHAGLRYVRCDAPGITRRAAGKGFVYVDAEGKRVGAAGVLNRIRSLVIPPAWRNVWICAEESGHLQATGVDARGRRQYRYHASYRAIRNQTKFARMTDFARALPNIRRHVARDLRRPGLPREKVIATVVQLLERTCIRVGNEEYARENSSYGLTTMRDRHVHFEPGAMRFSFRGKSGRMHEVEVHDRRLTRIVEQCRDLPGYELFQYRDAFGEVHSIDSSDVNAYIREAAGEDFTAKDFRTWTGTVLTAVRLSETGPAESKTEALHNVAEAIKYTADRLGNRPATCRNYYVHPAVVAGYLEGRLHQLPDSPREAGSAAMTDELSAEEKWVLALIRSEAPQALLTRAAG